MLDDDELAWLDEQLRGDFGHLLIGTSLPFLLAPGLHHVEAFNEALAGGGWGSVGCRGGREGPPDRRPRALGGVPERASSGSPGWRSRSRAASAAGAPATVTFLSGDVHHSYVSEAVDAARRAA